PASSRSAARAKSASTSTGAAGSGARAAAEETASAVITTARRARTAGRAEENRGPRHRAGRRSEAQRLGPAIGEDLDQLLVEEVGSGSNVLRNPLVVHLTAAIDVVAQALVEVPVLAALEDRALVVELDLRDEQPRETPRLIAALVARRD